MKRIIGLMLFSLMVVSGLWAQINEIEVNIYQEGVLVAGPETFAITPATNISETVTLNTSALSPGVYTYAIVVKESNGASSIAMTGAFVQEELLTDGLNLTAIEYFVDDDPGAGNGTAVSFTPSTEISLTQSINTSGLAEGFHTIFLRGKDESGKWGTYSTQTIFVQSSIGFDDVVEVEAVEYFMDTDPGAGNGTPLTITNGQEVSLTDVLATDALTPGFHNVFIRGKLAGGSWGAYQSQTVYINEATGYNDVVEISDLEYFIDIDPGQGNGTPITVTNGVEITVTELLATDTLSEGFHNLYMRGKLSGGSWGPYESRLIYVDPSSAGSQQINVIEYFFDEDPGTGAGFQEILTPADTFDAILSVNTAALTVGTHTMGIRARNVQGAWGPYEITEFTVDADTTAGTITITSPTSGSSFEQGTDIPFTFLYSVLSDTIDLNLEVSADGVSYTVVNTGPIGSLANEMIWSTDTSDTVGDYYIRIATNEGAYVEGLLAGTITLTAAPAPVAPSGLTVVSSTTTEASLSWVDNSTDESVFIVESSPDQVTWTEEIILPFDSTAVTISGLAADSNYFFRVLAQGIGGNSTPSNAVVVSTFTPPGNSIQLDNTDYISTGIAPVTGTVPFTLSIWFKTTNPGGQVLVTTRYSGGFSGIYYLGLTNGQLQFATGTGETVNSLFSNRTGLNDGYWHNVVAVREADGVLNLYIDGTFDNTKVNSNFSISGFPVTLGRNIRDGGAQFIGELDEFAIWNQALTVADISSNYLLPANVQSTTSTLVRYLDFDQSSGSTVFERVSGNPSVTLTGTFEWLPSAALQEYVDVIPPVVTVKDTVFVGTLPLLSGTIDDSTAMMTVSVNGETYSDVTISGMDWSVQTTVEIPDGVYDVMAVATDSLGNIGADSTVNELTILSQDPSRPLDSVALVNIYHIAGGPEWLNRENWLESNLEDWYGVTVENDRVVKLDLSANNLVDTIPVITTGLELLDSLILKDNELTSVSTSGLSGLDYLDVSGNRLVFDAIGVLQVGEYTLDYTNQKEVLQRQRVLLQLDESYTIDRTVPGGEAYTWYRDGSSISETGSSIGITITSFDDEASYHAEVTSSAYPGLILTTSPVDIRVSSLRRDEASLRLVLDALVTDPNLISVDWNTEDVENWSEVTLSGNNDRVIGIDFSGKKLSGRVPDDLLDVAGLTDIDLSDNDISFIPNMAELSSLTAMDVSSNRLDFGSINPNYSNEAITFGTQKPFGVAKSDTIARGSNKFVEVVTAGTSLSFQWAFKGNDIAGATQSFYEIRDISYETMGDYTMKVASGDAPGIELVSAPQTVLAYGRIEFYPSFTFADGELSFVEEGTSTLLKIKASGPYDTIKDVMIEDRKVLFEKIVLGDYLLSMRAADGYQVIKEIDETFIDTVEFIPTYFASVLEWDNAETLRLREFLVDTVTMLRIPAPLRPGDGDGTLDMTVESDFPEGEDAGGRLESRRRVRKAGCSLRRNTRVGGGREEEDEEWELIAYKETDDDGQVDFGYLPVGLYRINIQYPGIPMDPDSFVEFEISDDEEQDGYVLAATVYEDGIQVEVVEELGWLIEYFKELKVYPNPADDHIMISYEKLNSENVWYQLTDIQGKVHEEGRLEMGHRQVHELYTQDVKEGLYLLRLYDPTDGGKPLATYKLIIRH